MRRRGVLRARLRTRNIEAQDFGRTAHDGEAPWPRAFVRCG
jgi:hypothetical protein